MCARSELGEKEKSGKGKERKGGEKARKTNALDKVPQRVKQAQPARDDGHGGALAAGDDQGVALLQLLGRAHLGEGELERILLSFLLVLLLGRGGGGGDDVVGGPAQQRQVLDDAALEGQDADGDGLDGHGKDITIQLVNCPALWESQKVERCVSLCLQCTLQKLTHPR